ncbi:MAG TPA: AAA family ATPase [Geminicoccaceae bacterium]
MKLRRIELRQVRKFEQPVVVEDLSDGVNIVVGANEAGKSTLLAGLRAGLFLKHSSAAQSVTALRHHRNATAPEVALEIEREGIWRLEKRFLQGSRARLVRPDGSLGEGEAAEIEFRRMLSGGGEVATGLWNLLLVGQGEAVEVVVPGDARSVLQASFEASLGPNQGAGSAGALIGRLDQRLRGLVHGGHGAPIGRWRTLREELKAVREERRQAEARLDENLADLDALERTLSERRALAGPVDEPAAEAAIDRLEALRRMAAARRDAELRLAAVRTAVERREAAVGAVERAAGDLAEAEAALLEAVERREHAVVEGRLARAALEQARAALEAIERRAGTLRDLGVALGERARLQAAVQADAPEVVLNLSAAGLANLRLDGQRPPAARLRLRVRDRLAVDLGDLGQLEVCAAPERAGRARADLAGIEARIRDHLESLSEPPHEDAVLPDAEALEALRARLNDARSQTREALERAQNARIEQIAAWKAAEAQVRDREQARQVAAARRARLAAELEDARAQVPDEALAARLAAAEAERARPADAGSELPEVAALEAELDQARSALRERQSARHELDRRIDGLRAGIEARAAAGLREKLDQLAETEAWLGREDARITREVEVIRFLRHTLEQAESEVRDRYLRPLQERLQPYLNLLLPGAEARIDDTLRIEQISRAGTTEPFGQLSHGTREQIAVAIRLAFAEVLIDTGQPCFVVLDDALVFSDDDRLGRMFRILERAGRKVQILVLTCRERAFQGLAAKRLRIEPLGDAPEAQDVSARRLA